MVHNPTPQSVLSQTCQDKIFIQPDNILVINLVVAKNLPKQNLLDYLLITLQAYCQCCYPWQLQCSNSPIVFFPSHQKCFIFFPNVKEQMSEEYRGHCTNYFRVFSLHPYGIQTKNEKCYFDNNWQVWYIWKHCMFHLEAL